MVIDRASDNELLYRACLQDGSLAQAQAFEVIWQYVYSIAYSMLSTRLDGDALAADCAQTAIIKVYRNLAQCHDPARFRSWSAQITRHIVIDELRRPEHRYRADIPDALADPLSLTTAADTGDLQTILWEALHHGPLSERSRRVIVGRYFEEQADEVLAQIESQTSDTVVLPCHIQVTRSKNLSKLRQDTRLLARLRELLEE
jgi:RNA polymerase sigma factor (sigma-70 family)